jgi:hypothetical protein
LPNIKSYHRFEFARSGGGRDVSKSKRVEGKESLLKADVLIG